MKVGIIGVGVTGSALKEYLSNLNSGEFEICLYDPQKGHKDDLVGCKYVFICVPTPSHPNGEQDLSAIYDAVGLVPPDSVPVIRSTVVPGTTEDVSTVTGRPIAHVPEFLTERRAVLDMFEQDLLYCGYTGDIDLFTGLNHVFRDKAIRFCTPAEAELIKYVHNCFGALKVTFFNTVYDYCKKYGASFETVRSGVTNVTPFINKEHTFVPGPDGKRGWGGKCFPDNVATLAYHAKPNDIAFLLDLVRALNHKHRRKKGDVHTMDAKNYPVDEVGC